MEYKFHWLDHNDYRLYNIFYLTRMKTFSLQTIWMLLTPIIQAPMLNSRTTYGIRRISNLNYSSTYHTATQHLWTPGKEHRFGKFNKDKIQYIFVVQQAKTLCEINIVNNLFESFCDDTNTNFSSVNNN